MPYVLQGARGYAGQRFLNDRGNAECVEFIRQALGAPQTMKWREGQKIVRLADGALDPVVPGTAIATFVNKRYPQGDCGIACKHAAIYLGQNDEGIQVVDQDRRTGHVHPRTIYWKPHSAGASNDGNAFSVIE
ncbi:BPSL0067 family protein [Paraburkholderia caribensis]|uniref:BPSL0067 family protein n=1 Tax=Paraburkholderia caribensis TaxID=75105 RepID=UPI001D0638AB|nr:BPSL0067 family protein [Paraburkholderia caribensis]